jgi:hypothetical protein
MLKILVYQKKIKKKTNKSAKMVESNSKSVYMQNQTLYILPDSYRIDK